MKRQIKLYILLAILGLVMASPATAGEWIFGAKTGRTVINDSAIKTHPTSVGFMVGYEQGLVLGDFAIEGEITNTVSEAELDAGGGKFKVSTKAIYAAFRSAGPLYLKAKAGYLQADFDGTTESGSSYGIGLGFGIGIMQMELELTKTALDPDILFASVGVQF